MGTAWDRLNDVTSGDEIAFFIDDGPPLLIAMRANWRSEVEQENREALNRMRAEDRQLRRRRRIRR